MTEFVYAAAGDPLSIITWGPRGNAVTIHRGDVWWADDPFVLARPDLFSSTPLIAHSTIGRDSPEPTPLSEPKRRGRGRA